MHATLRAVHSGRMHQEPAKLRTVLGWAAFLACSWTWCIGMWLPVILARDYGPWAFMVFALPNCLGAAMMGVLLKSPGRSERITELHPGACVAFSGVTCAFQWFFAAWLLTPGTPTGLLAPLAAVLLAGVCYAGLRGRGRVGVVSGTVYVASLALLALWMFGTEAASPGPFVPASIDAPGLALLAPVMIFGFALSPYLDLTFHRARRALPGDAGNSAFIIGFMVLFWLMIFGTRFYAEPTNALAAGIGAALSPALLAWPLLLHVGMQLGFTIAAHHTSVRVGPTGGRAGAGVLLLSAPLGVAAAVAAPHLEIGMFTGAEVVYRGFMGFYGLVFPAYVWLCVIPRSGAITRPSPRHVLVFVGAVLAAAPCFALGFLKDREEFLPIGLAIVLLARLLIPATPAPQPLRLLSNEPDPAHPDQGSLA